MKSYLGVFLRFSMEFVDSVVRLGVWWERGKKRFKKKWKNAKKKTYCAFRWLCSDWSGTHYYNLTYQQQESQLSVSLCFITAVIIINMCLWGMLEFQWETFPLGNKQQAIFMIVSINRNCWSGFAWRRLGGSSVTNQVWECPIEILFLSLPPTYMYISSSSLS